MRAISSSFAAALLSLAAFDAAAATDSALDSSVMETLAVCKTVSISCSATTKNANGILVFPSVVKADFIVGGSGGKGALVENGRITGYYSIGAVSAGFQAGIEQASQVYVFRSAQSLARLKENNDWKVGANAGVTVVENDANAKAATGDVLAYVFDAKGLHGGISADVFDIWKTGTNRPAAQ